MCYLGSQTRFYRVSVKRGRKLKEWEPGKTNMQARVLEQGGKAVTLGFRELTCRSTPTTHVPLTR